MDWLELLEDFVAFWRFLISRKFRRRTLLRWREEIRGPLGWIKIPAEIIGSVGAAVIPICVIYWMFTHG